MNGKPRLAVILLRAEWFDSVVALPELTSLVQQDAALLVETLASSFEISGLWVVNSPQSLEACQAALAALEFDLAVLTFQVWAEDFYLMPLLEAIGSRPLVVWCYLPWQNPPRPAGFVDVLRGSGPVGTFEGLGTLRNLGVDYTFVYGAPGEQRLIAGLERVALAAQTRRALRSARFGILPARNEQMQSTFVDEFRLRAELGPSVEYLSAAQLKQAAAARPDAEVHDFVAQLKERFAVRGVSERTLESAARASLGMARLALERRLHLISLNDISTELHETLGLRPCLYPDLYDEHGILVGLEGDLGAAAAAFILHRLTASPLLFCEIWFWDEVQNLIVAGHAGPQNPRIARPGAAWISQDYEFQQSDATEGAHLQFIARPGVVTLLQLRGTPGGWQALAAAGEAVESEPWVEGYPHAVVRLAAPLERFLHSVAGAGSTQHWLMAYGNALGPLEEFGRLAKIPLEIIE